MATPSIKTRETGFSTGDRESSSTSGNTSPSGLPFDSASAQPVNDWATGLMSRMRPLSSVAITASLMPERVAENHSSRSRIACGSSFAAGDLTAIDKGHHTQEQERQHRGENDREERPCDRVASRSRRFHKSLVLFLADRGDEAENLSRGPLSASRLEVLDGWVEPWFPLDFGKLHELLVPLVGHMPQTRDPSLEKPVAFRPLG